MLPLSPMVFLEVLFFFFKFFLLLIKALFQKWALNPVLPFKSSMDLYK